MPSLNTNASVPVPQTLATLFARLQSLHQRRERSPYKFCCCFEAVDRELTAGWRQAHTEAEKSELHQIQNFLNSIQPDYETHLGAAAAQEKRSRPWFRRGKRNPVISGGRADGNT